MSKRKKHTFTLSEAAKKKLVLNLPYCMIGLYATKLGQAWRMAEGTNLSEKLLHLGDGFASAFASSLPSFHSADLLVGLLAGLLLRLAVYLKSKDAKKFRKGREYGSARWDAYYLLKEVFYGHRRRKHYDPIQQDYRAILPPFSR